MNKKSFSKNIPLQNGDINLTISLNFPKKTIIEPCHKISNNVVCATSKGSDQPAQSDQSIC